MRSRFSSIVLVVALGCGESDSSPTTPSGNGSTSGAGSARTLTGTFNGTQFTANTMTSAYSPGVVAVNATDGTRVFGLTGLGVNGPGTYSFAPGNSNSGTVQWTDPTGFYSTGYNGAGTITFTVLQLGRVAGSFNLTVKTLGVSARGLLRGFVEWFRLTLL